MAVEVETFVWLCKSSIVIIKGRYNSDLRFSFRNYLPISWDIQSSQLYSLWYFLNPPHSSLRSLRKPSTIFRKDNIVRNNELRFKIADISTYWNESRQTKFILYIKNNNRKVWKSRSKILFLSFHMKSNKSKFFQKSGLYGIDLNKLWTPR